MDPNATLSDIRKLIRNSWPELAAEKFDALDNWLSNGGMLPDAWATAPDPDSLLACDWCAKGEHNFGSKNHCLCCGEVKVT